MTTWKTAAIAAVLITGSGLGAIVAPVVHGQSTTPRARVAPRDVQIIGGRGSEIGVSIRDVDDSDAKAEKQSAPSGVIIEDVTAGSPAEKAGIKNGDVIVEFDGERVRSARQFARLVQETPAGRRVSASLLRAGQKTTVTVEPRAASGFRFLDGVGNLEVFQDFGRNFSLAVPPVPPAPPAAPFAPAPPVPPEPFFWRSGSTLGITVGDLSPQLADYFGTKDGVLVTSVREDSAAAKAGVKAGDVITSLNGIAIDTPAELRRRIQRLEDGEEFTLGIIRDRKALTIKGKVDQSPDRRGTIRSIV